MSLSDPPSSSLGRPTAQPQKSKPPFTLAIIGAGITSLCLARGLLTQHPHIAVRVFEARPDIGQDGSAFGIGSNGQEAMRLVDPELFECLRRAGGVPTVPQVRFFMGTGPHSGEHITDVYCDPPQITVRRGRLLTELRKLLPQDFIQTGYRVTSISQQKRSSATDEEAGRLTLTFDSQLPVTVDAVVGCDGINSAVRAHVLGPAHPALQPVFTKAYNTRIVIPMVSARAIFGEEYCARRTQTGWVGAGGFCLTDIEDDGEAMQVIAGFSSERAEAEAEQKAFEEVEKAFWTSRLAGWGWVGERISKVVEGQEKVWAAGLRMHPPTPTYSNASACIAGDAARAHSPARGAGAGQAVEDALMLHTVLGCVGRAGVDIARAFRVYDALRRPRRDLVADESARFGQMLQGRAPGIGLDIEKFKKEVEGFNDFIYEYPLKEVQEEARRLMETGI